MSASTKSKRRSSNQRLVTVAPANGKSRSIGNLSAICAGLGLGLVLSLELRGLKVAELSQTGPLLIFIGRITAMVGTYAVLLTLLLIARIPLLEREVGLDRTVSWHRKLAPWAMLLVTIHVVTTVVGPDCATADGLATALLVAGKSGFSWFDRLPGWSAQIVEGNLVTSIGSAFNGDE